MTDTPPLCTDLWLVRHGSRLDVEQPAWVETAARPHDTPITDSGWVQARETGAWLARELHVDHLFASPFLRAVQTATPIAAALGLPIRIEAGLAELFLARWFPRDPELPDAPTLAREFPAVDPDWRSLVPPRYPEDDAGAEERAARTMAALLGAHRGTVVCVSHGGAISLFCKALLGHGGGVHPRLCALIHLQYRDGAWLLRRDGSDGSHLSITEDKLRIF
jgi:transcription factor C subunit 7